MTDFKKGLKDGIPIALGYISVSFTFGLQAVGVGLAWWEAVMISFTNITSAGQFAGLDIMVRGGGSSSFGLDRRNIFGCYCWKCFAKRCKRFYVHSYLWNVYCNNSSAC